MNNHYHFYKLHSLTNKKHSHRLFGHTEYMLGIGFLHFHVYFGSTSFNGHFHTYRGVTGFAVKTPNGHRHKMAGKLELADTHIHYYENYTYENVEYTSGKLLMKIYHSP